jgi:hypothetical protein
MSETGTETTGRNASAALALKLAGASYDDIAATLGYAGPVQAREAVEQSLARRADEADPKEKDRLRALNAGRIERLLQSVWTRANDKRDPEQLKAVQVAASLIDRHTRLYGLDAPTQVAVTTPTTTEIEHWVAAVVAQQQSAITVEEDDVVVIAGEVVRDDGTAA